MILTIQEEINLSQKSFDSRVKSGPKIFPFSLQTTAYPQTPSFESEARISVDKEGVKARTQPRFSSSKHQSYIQHPQWSSESPSP